MQSGYDVHMIRVESTTKNEVERKPVQRLEEVYKGIRQEQAKDEEDSDTSEDSVQLSDGWEEDEDLK